MWHWVLEKSHSPEHSNASYQGVLTAPPRHKHQQTCHCGFEWHNFPPKTEVSTLDTQVVFLPNFVFKKDMGHFIHTVCHQWKLDLSLLWNFQHKMFSPGSVLGPLAISLTVSVMMPYRQHCFQRMEIYQTSSFYIVINFYGYPLLSPHWTLCTPLQ